MSLMQIPTKSQLLLVSTAGLMCRITPRRVPPLTELWECLMVIVLKTVWMINQTNERGSTCTMEWTDRCLVFSPSLFLSRLFQTLLEQWMSHWGEKAKSKEPMSHRPCLEINKRTPSFVWPCQTGGFFCLLLLAQGWQKFSLRQKGWAAEGAS